MKRFEDRGHWRGGAACAMAIAAALGATLLAPAPGARGDDNNGSQRRGGGQGHDDNGSDEEDKPVIRVSTAAELQAAVNNRANEGVVVQVLANIDSATGELTPYLLTEYLGLQPRMDLVGQVVNVNGVTKKPTIDGSQVPFRVDRDPSVQLITFGRKNRVKDLTIENFCFSSLLGTPNDAAAVGEGWRGEVIGCTFLGGGPGALRLINRPGTDGFRSHFIVEGNLFDSAAFAPAVVVNNSATTNARIRAVFRDNTFSKNAFGLIIRGAQSSSYCEVDARLEGNRFLDTPRGLTCVGGGNASGWPLCRTDGDAFSQAHVTSERDSFVNNAAIAVVLYGSEVGDVGLLPAPAFVPACPPALAQPSSHNTVDFRLEDASLVVGKGQRAFGFFGSNSLTLHNQGRCLGGGNEVNAAISNPTITSAPGALPDLFVPQSVFQGVKVCEFRKFCPV